MGRWRRRKNASLSPKNTAESDDDGNNTSVIGNSSSGSENDVPSSPHDDSRTSTCTDNNSLSNPVSFNSSTSSSAVSLESSSATSAPATSGASAVSSSAELYVRQSYTAGRSSKKKKNSPSNFTSFDRECLRGYLVEYREGVFNYLEGIAVENSSDKNDNQRVVRIAGHDFPALTEDILQKPYLSLPTTLSSKQRKCLHELCVDVGLYHSGAGDKSIANTRYIVVSVYIDGLEHVPDLYAPLAIPTQWCKPWFYRNEPPNDEVPHIDTGTSDTYVSRQTKIGRDMVQSLIDQPSRCLRDAHDSIDFVDMEDQDLSDYPLPSSDDGDDLYMLVDNADKMKLCVKEILDSHPSELAFDLEMYNQSKYTQITCLFQLSTDQGKDYVIDVLAPGVWNAVSLLAPIFADPNIVKIGHSIGGMDVPSLHRDFGIFVVNAFDTYEAAKALHLKRSGLATICEHYGLKSSEEYALLKKEYQNTDWRRRPLTEPMIRYGRYDVHFLVKLRSLLIRDLTKGQLFGDTGLDHDEEAEMVARALAETFRVGQRFDDDEDEVGDTGDFPTTGSVGSESDDYLTAFSESDNEDDEFFDGNDVETSKRKQHQSKKKKSLFLAKDLRMHLGLMNVISISQDRCLGLWADKIEPAEKHDSLISVIRKSAFGGTEWRDLNMLLYRKLATWRDNVATKEGTIPGLVCSLDFLVSVASKLPVDKPGLRRLSFFLPALLEDKSTDYAKDMLQIVRSLLEENGHQANNSSHAVLTYKGRKMRVTATVCNENGQKEFSIGKDSTEKKDDSINEYDPVRSAEEKARDINEENDNKKSKKYLTTTKVVSILAVIAIGAGVVVLAKKRKR